jgi:AbiV family abortive infection protein
MEIQEGFYIEGYKITLDNAKSLQKVAELVYRRKSYGAACALNIMAAEEGIKAMFILLKHIFPDAQILDFGEAFKDNSINQAHIDNFIAVYDLTMQKLHESVAPQWQSFKDVKKKPFSSRKKVHPHFDELYIACSYLMEYKEREITLKHIVDWLQSENEGKLNGIYVGLNGDSWQSPKGFDTQKYVAEKRLTKEVLLMAEQIETIYHRLSTWLK